MHAVSKLIITDFINIRSNRYDTWHTDPLTYTFTYIPIPIPTDDPRQNSALEVGGGVEFIILYVGGCE